MRTRANLWAVQLQTRVVLYADPKEKVAGSLFQLGKALPQGPPTPRTWAAALFPISSVLSTHPIYFTAEVGSVVALLSPKICPSGTSEGDLIWSQGLCRCHSGKDLLIRSSWIRVGLKPNDTCLYKRQKRVQRHRRWAREDGGRDWVVRPQAKGCPGPGSTKNWGTGLGTCSLGVSEGASPADALISGFCPPDCKSIIHVCHFRLPSLWSFGTAAPGNASESSLHLSSVLCI